MVRNATDTIVSIRHTIIQKHVLRMEHVSDLIFVTAIMDITAHNANRGTVTTLSIRTMRGVPTMGHAFHQIHVNVIQDITALHANRGTVTE